jgi:hypothetical protein
MGFPHRPPIRALVTCAAVIALSLAAFSADTWVKAFKSGDPLFLGALRATADGGFVAAGATKVPGRDWDAAVVKLAPDGSVQWRKAYGDATAQVAQDILEMPDGGFLVAAGNLLRLDAAGHLIGQVTFRDGPEGAGVQVLQAAPDGGAYVAGPSSSSPSGLCMRAFVARLDADGNPVWQHFVGFGDFDTGCFHYYPAGLAVTPEGNLALAGFIQGALEMGWVALLNPEGTFLWQRKFIPDPMFWWHNLYSVAALADGDLVAAGSVSSVENGFAWVMVLDREGTLRRSRILGDRGIFWDLNHAYADPSGGALLTGMMDSWTFGRPWAVRLDATGQVVSQGTFALDTFGGFGAAAPHPEGGFLIAGDLGGSPWMVDRGAVYRTDPNLAMDCPIGIPTKAKPLPHEIQVYDVRWEEMPPLCPTHSTWEAADFAMDPVDACAPPCALECEASVSDSSVYATQFVLFRGRFDSSACDAPGSFFWTFGDGDHSFDPEAWHAYTAPGTYHWKYWANSAGALCTREGIIRVKPILPGDCDGDGSVSIGEVQRCLNFFLGLGYEECLADCDGDGTLSIGEVQKAIDAFLGLPSSCEGRMGHGGSPPPASQAGR